MHKFSIAFALVAGTIVCPASLAGSQPEYYFGKANVGDEEFQRDRDACSNKATRPVWGSHQTPIDYTTGLPGQPFANPPQMRGGGTVTTLIYPADRQAFVQCMLAKGYKQGLPPMPAGKAGLYEFRRFAKDGAEPGQVFQLCVPPDGAKLLAAMAGLNPSCTYSNVMGAPHGFATDAICQGGQFLHIAFESTTPESREFTVYRQPTPNGGAPRIDKLQITWVASDCGSIPPGQVRTPDGRLVPMPNP